jgi:hypothetical protein
MVKHHLYFTTIDSFVKLTLTLHPSQEHLKACHTLHGTFGSRGCVLHSTNTLPWGLSLTISPSDFGVSHRDVAKAIDQRVA